MFNKASDIQVLEEVDQGNANTFVYQLLKRSIQQGASDIHIDLCLSDLNQMAFKVRYRVDGHCFDDDHYSDITLYRGIVNKLKLDAGLKIDERRLPQDGRISFEFEEKNYHFRLSFMPNTIRNQQEEKIVLRQMADVSRCHLSELNIVEYQCNFLKAAVKLPHGFICVTGPTGSGKTTLLYALLQEINRQEKNCITLEDPIEAELPMVNQSQIFHRIGYDFAQGLRVILRQDPDVVMVGEMRDEETASKAFEAANTGHLVFSTLHTNSAASTITRLLQMKVSYYFISSSLKYIVAQRLVRRICSSCHQPHKNSKEVHSWIEEAFQKSPQAIRELYKAHLIQPNLVQTGDSIACHNCQGSGYKGRLAIMEVMEVNEKIRRLIHSGQGGQQDNIQSIAEESGMLTLKQYGYLQVLKGYTTFEEVNNVISTH